MWMKGIFRLSLDEVLSSKDHTAIENGLLGFMASI